MRESSLFSMASVSMRCGRLVERCWALLNSGVFTSSILSTAFRITRLPPFGMYAGHLPASDMKYCLLAMGMSPMVSSASYESAKSPSKLLGAGSGLGWRGTARTAPLIVRYRNRVTFDRNPQTCWPVELDELIGRNHRPMRYPIQAPTAIAVVVVNRMLRLEMS